MDRTSEVLVIAYYFPPMGGAGVQRTLKFVKYLPDYGWQPHVLTVRTTSDLLDAGLEEDIPANINIIRTNILQIPGRLPWRLRNFISRWFLIVDEQVGWLPFASTVGRKIIASGNFEVIYSTSAPYTAHLIARNIHRRTDLPWVADFRDPWVGNPFIKFPTVFHRRLNERLEHSIIIEADKVIINTESSRQFYTQKYSHIPDKKFITITNGYDQTDIPAPDHVAQIDHVFTIVHLGSLYRNTRSAKYFLKALSEVFQFGMLQSKKILVRFVGNIDTETKNLISQLNLQDNVELLGYLPHRQALSQAATADLLLLVPSYGAGSELFIPAKLFEYLACRKPIICLAEPGECADLVLQAKAGSVISPTDTNKIASQLVGLYHQWENGTLHTDPNVELIASFERRKLTEKLVKVFNNLSGRVQ